MIPNYKRKLPIFINKNLVSSALSNFPYQIDLSTKLASDTEFKAAINSRANICIYDPVSDLVKPAIIKIDLTNNKMFAYFDGSTQTAADKEFNILAGPEINNADSAQAFSLSGYSNFWGFPESSNGVTTEEIIDSKSGTVVSPATIGNAGKFGYSASFVGTGTNRISTTRNGDYGANGGSIEALIYPTGLGGGSAGRILSSYASSNGWLFSVASTNRILYYQGGATVYSANNAFALNQWTHLLGIIKPDGKVTLFVNGIISGTPDTQVYSTVLTNMIQIGNDLGGGASFLGSIDNVGLISIPKDSNFAMIRSNMLLNPGSFFTIGNSSEYPNKKPNRNFSLSPLGIGRR